MTLACPVPSRRLFALALSSAFPSSPGGARLRPSGRAGGPENLLVRSGARFRARRRPAAAGPELEDCRNAFLDLARQTLKDAKELPQDYKDALGGLDEMTELEELGSIFEVSVDRAFARERREGRLEGKLETLSRLALKKFGANGQGELPRLVAMIDDDNQLDDALDYLLECSDPGQFAIFLKRKTNGR